MYTGANHKRSSCWERGETEDDEKKDGKNRTRFPFQCSILQSTSIVDASLPLFVINNRLLISSFFSRLEVLSTRKIQSSLRIQRNVKRVVCRSLLSNRQCDFWQSEWEMEREKNKRSSRWDLRYLDWYQPMSEPEDRPITNQCDERSITCAWFAISWLDLNWTTHLKRTNEKNRLISKMNIQARNRGWDVRTQMRSVFWANSFSSFFPLVSFSYTILLSLHPCPLCYFPSFCNPLCQPRLLAT